MAIDTQEQFLLSAALLRGKERTLLSSNIANAKTPRYHARHLDFQSALADQEQKDIATLSQMALKRSDERHIHQQGMDIATLQYVRVDTKTSDSPDGNTVNMNEERSRFVQSTIHESLMLSLLKSHYHQLQVAITGQG